MAQSHIKLTGGLRDGKSMRNVITQNGHGFVAGQAIRFNREAATGISGDFYTAAIADSALNAEVIGVVESTTENTFDLVYGGEISLAGFDPSFSVTDNDVFFLSGVTAGLLTSIPPSSAGKVIKPVVVRTEGDTGVVTNYVGTVIGGSSVVNLDGIQPVGAIEPYAGSATDVPDGWSLCDGGSLSITEYASLYNRVGRNYGYNVKFTPSTASTITSSIQVGMKIQQGTLTGRITEVNAASNYIVVDVDYLELNTDADGFRVHDFVFSNTIQTKIPNGAGLGAGTFFGSLSGDDDVQPDNEITLGLGTFEITHFRKPDLRNKVAMGTAELGKGTVREADRLYSLGQIGGNFTHTLTEAQMPAHSHSGSGSVSTRTGSVGGSSPFSQNNSSGRERAVQSQTVNITTDIKGEGAGHNNLQPYVAINWIIKTTALASAAVVDSLSLDVPFTGLSDVDMTPANGDVPMYDTSTTPDKFRPYRLLTNYKSDASQIFQIDTSGNLPKVKVGSPPSDNGFSVNLDGIGSGTSKFEVVNNSGTPLFEVQKDSSTSTGMGSIGTGIDTNANLTIGAKGLKFLSSSPVVTKVKDNIAPSGSATDTNLVTEKAVRDAIDVGSSSMYHIASAVGDNGTYQKEIFPNWVSTVTSGTGSSTYTGTGVSVRTVSSGAANNVSMAIDISNGTGADIIISAHFGGMINRDGTGANINYNMEGGDFEILVPAGAGIPDSGISAKRIQGTSFSNVHTFEYWSRHFSVDFRKATALETTRGFGHGRLEYHQAQEG